MRKFFSTLLLRLKRAAVFFVSFSFLLVLVLRWIPVSYTPLMFIRLVDDKGKTHRIDHQWVNYEHIPNQLQLAVVCTEDQRFLTHYGFDFESIKDAMDEANDGGRHRGASTISQQTAKNVFLWPQSSWMRKGLETWFTVLIETCWSKRRILEVYLNSIEFGDGIYGCEAASQHFFHKEVTFLSNSEAARLAVVLPDPLGLSVNSSKGKVITRMNWALEQMRNFGNVLSFEPTIKAGTR
ncbi:MAG TPA: monofunctional biosynthetic peptidoglycan transglycosylase [Bacteroidia bacterium]|nr:monofunctional biosynthetic peptidoglycan transglycosylase [Bacteroidia bacterium]